MTSPPCCARLRPSEAWTRPVAAAGSIDRSTQWGSAFQRMNTMPFARNAAARYSRLWALKGGGKLSTDHCTSEISRCQVHGGVWQVPNHMATGRQTKIATVL